MVDWVMFASKPEINGQISKIKTVLAKKVGCINLFGFVGLKTITEFREIEEL